MSFNRQKDNLLSANNLRKFAGFAIFNQAAKSNFKLTIPKSVQHGKILVLSPHPDDDASAAVAHSDFTPKIVQRSR